MSSVASEFGSQFSGAGVAALADMMSNSFTIEAADMLTLEKHFGNDSPIFVGTLPFHNGNYQFKGHLLMDWKALRILTNTMELM